MNPDNSILAAGGFIIQLMPGTSEDTISKIEKRLSTITPVSKMIQNGMTPEEILTEILGEGNVNILEKMDVQFSCQCSSGKNCDCIDQPGAG